MTLKYEVAVVWINPLLRDSAFWCLWNNMYYVFENIMENWAFAPLEQMLHFL